MMIGNRNMIKLNKKWSRQRRLSGRRGATAVEFAMVLPLALLFIFGLIELFNIQRINNTLKTAMILGSREALITTARSEDIESEIRKVLDIYGVAGAQVSVSEFDQESLKGTISIELDSASSGSFVIRKFFKGKLKRTAEITRVR